MKWSFATIGMFLLGVMGVAVIILFQKLTTSNENDYYLLKEITESAMYDSIDLTYYRKTGNIKIVREKFVENFTRRFSQSTLFIGTNYIISFYDIMEEPPKASIFVNTGIENYRIYGEETENSYNVQNVLTGILEMPYSNKNDPYTHKTLSKEYYSMPAVSNGEIVVTEPLNIPSELSSNNIKNIKFKVTNSSIVNPSTETGFNDLLRAKLMRELDWARAVNTNYRTIYSEKINPNNYATTLINGPNISTYNCLAGERDSSIDCNSYNTVWLKWNGRINNNYEKVILKIFAVWEYDEYEY